MIVAELASKISAEAGKKNCIDVDIGSDFLAKQRRQNKQVREARSRVSAESFHCHSSGRGGLQSGSRL